MARDDAEVSMLTACTTVRSSNETLKISDVEKLARGMVIDLTSESGNLVELSNTLGSSIVLHCYNWF